jgi:hypothetical protein
VIPCKKCGTEECPAVIVTRDHTTPLSPEGAGLLVQADIACSLRSIAKQSAKMPDLSSAVGFCPHGYVWCGMCVSTMPGWQIGSAGRS